MGDLVPTNAYFGCMNAVPGESTSGTLTRTQIINNNSNQCSYVWADGSWALVDTNCALQGYYCDCLALSGTIEVTTNNTLNTWTFTITGCQEFEDNTNWYVEGYSTVSNSLSNPFTREDLVDFLSGEADNQLNSANWTCSGDGYFSLSKWATCGTLRKSTFQLKCMGPRDVVQEVKLEIVYSIAYRAEGSYDDYLVQCTNTISTNITYSGGVDILSSPDFVLDPLSPPYSPTNNAVIRSCSVSLRMISPETGGCTGGGGFASKQVELIQGPFASFGLGDCGGTDAAGFLFLQGRNPDPTLATPAGLDIFANMCKVEVVGNPIQQVVVRDHGIVEVSTNGVTDGYAMRFYSAFTTNGTAYEPVSESLLEEYTVSLQSTNPFRLRITGSYHEFLYSNDWWYLDYGDGYWAEACKVDTDENGKVTTNQSRTLGPGGELIYTQVSSYTNLPPDSKQLLQSTTIGDGNDALTSLWFYNTEVPTNDINYGKLIKQIDGYGGWERYEYDTNSGQKTTTITGYANSSSNEAQ